MSTDLQRCDGLCEQGRCCPYREACTLEALKDTLQLLEVYCGDFEEGTRKQARAVITRAEGKV
jgi:hypothetical protein